MSRLREGLTELDSVRNLNTLEMAQRDMLELVSTSRLLELDESIASLNEGEKAERTSPARELSSRLEAYLRLLQFLRVDFPAETAV